MQSVKEYEATRISGLVILALVVLVIAVAIVLFYHAVSTDAPALLLLIVPLIIADVILLRGFYVVQPNQARVLVLLGQYRGSCSTPGFWWTNPFAAKRSVRLAIRNFNSEKLKVNDLNGNPIEIAAVIVWRVVDSARALFDVQDCEEFVGIQAETAIRTLASQYAYDSNNDNRPSLLGNAAEVMERLKQEVHQRLEIAGVEIMDARISHLAYAPEIAQAMLRRQQAEAIVAARQKIVEGAVGMVQEALELLSRRGVVTLDEEKKATMVNNLMVALVSDREAQPVLNTGTLFQ
jgi:regulator of protease activity HflC (stomatin/prohibitin superfamily)